MSRWQSHQTPWRQLPPRSWVQYVLQSATAEGWVWLGEESCLHTASSPPHQTSRLLHGWMEGWQCVRLFLPGKKSSNDPIQSKMSHNALKLDETNFWPKMSMTVSLWLDYRLVKLWLDLRLDLTKSVSCRLRTQQDGCSDVFLRNTSLE